MSGCVLDCSAVAGWCFEDEKDRWADDLIEHVGTYGAVVPSHWHLEAANMLLQAEKRRRIHADDMMERLAVLACLPITVDTATSYHAFHAIVLCAKQERLTSYDAAYLELAMRQGLPLATKDQDLKKACKRLGVECL